MMPWLQSHGYRVQVEKGRFGSRNLVIGDPETAEYLITAHYDTCAELPFPNFITPCSLFGVLLWQLLLILLFLLLSSAGGWLLGTLFSSQPAAFLGALLTILLLMVLTVWGPANPHCVNDNTSGVITLLEIAKDLPLTQRSRVCFVLFDLEEAGLIGSRSYRKAHRKATDRQLNLNLDCVGDGDQIMFFPTAGIRKSPRLLQLLEICCGTFGKSRSQSGKRALPSIPPIRQASPGAWASAPCGKNSGSSILAGSTPGGTPVWTSPM